MLPTYLQVWQLGDEMLAPNVLHPPELLSTSNWHKHLDLCQRTYLQQSETYDWDMYFSVYEEDIPLQVDCVQHQV